MYTAHGSQYTSGVVAGMSELGSNADNATVESLNPTFRREKLKDERADRASAQHDSTPSTG